MTPKLRIIILEANAAWGYVKATDKALEAQQLPLAIEHAKSAIKRLETVIQQTEEGIQHDNL